MFQSSPAPRRGRYLDKADNLLRLELFQSSPAPRRGRYQTPFGRFKYEWPVSILARAEARALLATGNLLANLNVVSILARAEARALQCGFDDVGFGVV